MPCERDRRTMRSLAIELSGILRDQRSAQLRGQVVRER
jgi:hypothetical protein